MVNTRYKTAKKLMIKLQQTKGERNPKNHQALGIYYNQATYRRQGGYFQFEEELSAKNSQGLAKIFHGVLL